MASGRRVGVELELEQLQKEMQRCTRCVEEGFPIVPGAIFSGGSTAKLMLVGQAPGASEVAAERPFHGPSGRRLFGWLARAGLAEGSVRERHYICSITRCYPGRRASGRGDRTPGRKEQELCRRFLDAELELIQPLLIVPIGRLAIRPFLGAQPLNAVVGTATQDEAGRWIVPLPHPSGASHWLNDPENAAHVERAIRHLARLRRLLEL